MVSSCNSVKYWAGYLLLFLSVIGAVTNAAANSSWHMANINATGKEGDAHILVTEGVVTMIDAGEYVPAKEILLPYLKRNGITKIDHFFISHPHNDHYRGLDALLESSFPIKNIYYNLPPDGVSDTAFSPVEFAGTLHRAKSKGGRLHNIGKGFQLSLSAKSGIRAVYAHKEKLLGGEEVSVNDYSLILRWEVEGFRVLFTGDLNVPLGKALSSYEYIKADILKVPHHGVATLAPDEFFDGVNPQLNMFTTPEKWTHSRMEQAKSWTLRRNIPYCITGLNGHLVVNFTDSKLSLQPERPSEECPAGRVAISPGEKEYGGAVIPSAFLLLSK